MKLVLIVMPGCFFSGKGWRWEVWDDRISEARLSYFMGHCKSYAPGFRLVTLESAREDYGVVVPAVSGGAR